ncbi:hypothetical protein EV360DRAFT_72708 [Lentinula raphanica]|nr:hypothetical protein EV360DRAFT_72708 [Lentinula raphanica]
MHSRFLLRLSLPSTTFIYLFLASLALSVVASALSTPGPQSLTQRADADAMDVDSSPVCYTGIPQSMSSDSMSPESMSSESIEGIKQHTPPPSPPRTPTPTKESPAKKPSTEVQTYPVRIARYDRKNGEFILNTVDFSADQEFLVVFGQIAIAPLQFGREILHAFISPDNSIMLGPGRKTDIVLTQQDYERVIHNLWDREHSKILYQGMTTDLEVLDKVVQCLKTGCHGLSPQVFKNGDDQVAVEIIGIFRKLRAGEDVSDRSAMPKKEEGDGAGAGAGAGGAGGRGGRGRGGRKRQGSRDKFGRILLRKNSYRAG